MANTPKPIARAKTPKNSWTYQSGEETPDAPPHISQDDWEKLSPGMRREIKRQNEHWWGNRD